MAKTCGPNERNKDLFDAFKQRRITLGELIRACREQKGWSTEQLGKWYGQALREKAIKAETIERMETTNDVPNHPKRRYVLAKLLDIPLGLLSLEYLEKNNRLALAAARDPKKPLDLQEYKMALQELKEQHHFNHAQDTLYNAIQRIRDLHDAFPYRVRERGSIAPVLTSFNAIVGRIFRDRQDFESAIKYQTDAAVIAEASKLPVLYAEALDARASSYLNKAETTTALGGKQYRRYHEKSMKDFQDALRAGRLPQPIRASLLLGIGITQVSLAEDETDIEKALLVTDEVGTLIEQPGYNDYSDTLYPSNYLGKHQYYQDRATMLLRAQTQDLHRPDEALQLIKLVRKEIDPSFLRRNAFLDIRAARAYIDKGEYPKATKLLRGALSVMEAIGSRTNIARIVQLYNVLKASSDRDSFEVAQLGIALMKIQHPDIFDRDVDL